MGEDALKKFGRYFLLDRIAQGGMAEIFRARLAIQEGAGRILVIKRIQQGYGENKDFIQMFQSEIQVTMGFNHPNIVQVYDFGSENNQPYIAMEMVDGKNLRQVVQAFSKNGETLPVELAVYCIELSASGLQYAHSFRDKISGVSLNIVHRDISPQNVLMSYDGNIKIIDFGIAKATTNTDSTRAGVIKGKPSYLSPEQISGEELDCRSDVFALGIVLWELLTAKKLFAVTSGNEFQVLKLIESCDTYVKPPSTFNSDVPKELDYIVLKALAKKREKRYQNAEELQRALHKFLYSYSPEFSPADLSYVMKKLFQNEIVNDRKMLQNLNAKAEELLSSNLPEAPDVPLEESGGSKEDTTTMIRRQNSKEKEILISEAVQSAKVEIQPSPAVSRSQNVVRGRFNKRGDTLTVNTPHRKSKSRVGGMLKKLVFLSAAASLAVVFFGDEMGIDVPFLSKYIGEKKVKQNKVAKRTGFKVSIKQTIIKKAVQNKNRTIQLRLNLTPGSMKTKIQLNGQSLNPNNPVAQVPLDTPLEIFAYQKGYREFRREFVLSSKEVGGLNEWLMDIAMTPNKFGYLSIHTTPSADAIIKNLDRGIASNQAPWVLKTPIEQEKFPVGNYQVKLVNEVLGMEKIVKIQVTEGGDVNINERLDVKR